MQPQPGFASTKQDLTQVSCAQLCHPAAITFCRSLYRFCTLRLLTTQGPTDLGPASGERPLVEGDSCGMSTLPCESIVDECVCSVEGG